MASKFQKWPVKWPVLLSLFSPVFGLFRLKMAFFKRRGNLLERKKLKIKKEKWPVGHLFLLFYIKIHFSCARKK